eukprot:12331890-Heterocapsa_arctica.AAC.1
MLSELSKWQDLSCFKRMKKHLARNRIDSRWVLKWKLVDDIKQVRARLTVRGFKDLQTSHLETFAGTSSRWGQRLICSVAATNGWKLWSAD